MKIKETQILGLFIMSLLILITFDFYTIYSLVNYGKLITTDVVTSFAVTDALFYQALKFFIVTYLIFYVSIEIKNKFAEREKIRMTEEKVDEVISEFIRKRVFETAEAVRKDFFETPSSDSSTQSETCNEGKGNFTTFVGDEDKFEPLRTEPRNDFEETKKDIIESAKAADLEFDDPMIEFIQIVKRYGKKAVESLTILQRKFLLLDPPTTETLQSLYLLDGYYENESEYNKGSISQDDLLSWQNVANDIISVKKVLGETITKNEQINQ